MLIFTSLTIFCSDLCTIYLSFHLFHTHMTANLTHPASVKDDKPIISLSSTKHHIYKVFVYVFGNSKVS